MDFFYLIIIKTIINNINKMETSEEINDIRTISSFKGISFSQFKKTDVKNMLLKSLINGQIEHSCYWSAELICAGHYHYLWDIYLFFYSKYIHIGNPKLCLYLKESLNQFRTIINEGYTINDLAIRNNTKVRKLFCKIVCLLCYSKQKHALNEIKVKKEDFSAICSKERLKAPNVDYGQDVFLKEDPILYYMAINELAFHLSSESKNGLLACYWIEYIMELEESYKYKTKIERRTFAPVDPIHQMDIIWLIWDTILKQDEKDTIKVKKEILYSLLELYCLKYSKTSFKKRKFILYFAVSLLIEHVDTTIPLISDNYKKQMKEIIPKINMIYKQIKQKEEKPNTDYLFLGNEKERNLENTLKKLKAMNDFGDIFITRA